MTYVWNLSDILLCSTSFDPFEDKALAFNLVRLDNVIVWTAILQLIIDVV